MLSKAAELVAKERQDEYGPVGENLARIAAMWGAYLGVRLAPHDVAALMVLLKVSRIAYAPKTDSWVDVAGYAAIGEELSADGTATEGG